EICPGPSLTDFITDAEKGVKRARIRNLLAALPLHELQAMAEVDPKSGRLGSHTNIALMIRLMPLERQQELIEMIRAEVAREGGPPEGVEVAVGGLPVIAAETASDLGASRYWLTLAALAAVLLVLAVALRSPTAITAV